MPEWRGLGEPEYPHDALVVDLGGRRAHGRHNAPLRRLAGFIRAAAGW